jgi:hypothetical protein
MDILPLHMISILTKSFHLSLLYKSHFHYLWTFTWYEKLFLVLWPRSFTCPNRINAICEISDFWFHLFHHSWRMSCFTSWILKQIFGNYSERIRDYCTSCMQWFILTKFVPSWVYCITTLSFGFAWHENYF